MKRLLALALLSHNCVHAVNLHQKTITNTNTVEDSEAEQSMYQKSLSQLGLKEFLTSQEGEFSQEIFEKMMMQDKDLSHLLYSDMTELYQKVAKEFSDIMHVQKIGESWQRREIHVVTLDARDMMQKKGISPKAPEKAAKDEKDGKDGKDKKEQKQGELAINPNNVMVALAQTGSKFFDIVQHEEEALPQTAEDNVNAQNATKTKKKREKQQKTLDEEMLDDPEKVNEEDHHFHGDEYVLTDLEMKQETGNNQNAILITGTTHPRELLSMQAPVYTMLKLLHQGVVKENPKYQQMLAASKFHFLPILNVDGSALVEKHYKEEKKVINKRKNMSPGFINTCGSEDAGTDLNRNWPMDWKALDKNNPADVCGEYWPGTEPLSEPENKALNDFVAANSQDLKFIVNCHTSGNDFVWPFNGRDKNDIETRAPGYLAIFNDIAKNAEFPSGVMFGNSQQVMGEAMNGDCDDYMLATYGIPSVTSEMGHLNQYVNDWKCISTDTCYDILEANTKWMEYLFQNIGKVAAIVKPKTS